MSFLFKVHDLVIYSTNGLCQVITYMQSIFFIAFFYSNLDIFKPSKNTKKTFIAMNKLLKFSSCKSFRISPKNFFSIAIAQKASTT